MTQICTGNPSQLWAYDEPVDSEIGIGNLQTVMSESEVLKTFYPHWAQLMYERGKLLLVTEVNCLDDWICNNWAYKYA